LPVSEPVTLSCVALRDGAEDGGVARLDVAGLPVNVAVPTGLGKPATEEVLPARLAAVPAPVTAEEHPHSADARSSRA
jgi:hypothetical protein